jgi:hypothetical protein
MPTNCLSTVSIIASTTDPDTTSRIPLGRSKTLVHTIDAESGWLTYWKEVAPGPEFLKDCGIEATSCFIQPDFLLSTR